MISNIQVAVWNIHGWLLLKLSNAKVWDMLKPYDVVFILETHLRPEEEDAISLPADFQLFHYSRPAKSNGDPSGGGVIALVRSSLRPQLCDELCSPDIVTMRISDVYLVGAYILPDRSPFRAWTDCSPEDKLLELLTLLDTSHLPYIVLGDLNARTGSVNSSVCLPRCSPDHVINTRGRRLLQCLRNADSVILNGTRLDSHSPSRMTSFQAGGCAVVDYAVCCNDAVTSGLVRAFNIEDKTQWSDHALLSVSLAIPLSEACTLRECDTYNLPPPVDQ